jgi:hypothetical protein
VEVITASEGLLSAYCQQRAADITRDVVAESSATRTLFHASAIDVTRVRAAGFQLRRQIGKEHCVKQA